MLFPEASARIFTAGAILSLVVAGNAWGQATKIYADATGKKHCLPHGDRAFADKVLYYSPGEETPPPSGQNDPQQAVGPKDYSKASRGYVSLGCKAGEIALEFTDNVLVDGIGDDLIVFEIGPSNEATDVSVSVDSTHWHDVGQVAGSVSTIDLGGSKTVPKQHKFRFVRLVNRSATCDSNYPGADIDAVAALVSLEQHALSDSDTRFEFDKWGVTEAGEKRIAQIASSFVPNLKGAKIELIGHTDNIGPQAYNLQLSERRAKSVRDFLVKLGFPARRISYLGSRMRQPIDTNDTEEGRRNNRRVELIYHPPSECTFAP